MIGKRTNKSSMSKTVKYWTTGTRQPNFTAVGTPAELLKWVAGFPPSKDVPPRAVLNDVFRKGFQEGGFNGDTHWEPFELSPAEYDDFVQELLADDKACYRTLESPEWIQTELDWLAYVSWKRDGVPLEPYRKLLYRLNTLIAAQRAARSSGRKLAHFVRTLQLFAVLRRMQRFLAKYAEHSNPVS